MSRDAGRLHQQSTDATLCAIPLHYHPRDCSIRMMQSHVLIETKKAWHHWLTSNILRTRADKTHALYMEGCGNHFGVGLNTHSRFSAGYALNHHREAVLSFCTSKRRCPSFNGIQESQFTFVCNLECGRTFLASIHQEEIAVLQNIAPAVVSALASMPADLEQSDVMDLL